MLVLISGQFGPGALEREYESGLKALGCRIVRHHSVEDRYLHFPVLARKVGRRLSPRLYNWQSNHDVLKLARTRKPDVVLVFKGADLLASTIRKLRQEGYCPVNYNPDHPFEFYSRGTGNSNIASAVPEYELYITYSRQIADQLSDRYPHLRTLVVPFGHSVETNAYDAFAAQDEVLRLSFVGTPDNERAERLRVLIAAGLDVDIYGNGWDHHERKVRGARLCGPVTGLAMFEVLNRYRVQLNLLRPHNFSSHNMRSFEVPACGGIMLAQDSIEQRKFFRPGLEAHYFSGDDEMVSQAQRLFQLSLNDANLLRRGARDRSVSQPFSYHHRAGQVLDHLMALVNRDDRSVGRGDRIKTGL